MNMTMHFDVVIVGGGLVGAGLALALQGVGLRIALVEAKNLSPLDQRLFALNASSCQFLKNLTIWDTLSTKASAIHQVHASRQGYFGAVRLKKEDVAAEALGYVIPAKEVEQALSESLMALSEDDCKIYRPATLLSLNETASGVELKVALANGTITLASAIVIGADGTESTVRKALAIEVDDTDYQQTAIVFKTKLQRSHEHVAYERFIHEGAIAMLPLSDNQCASICTVDNRYVDNWLSLGDQHFLEKLQHKFGYRLGRLQSVSARYTYPLHRRYAKKTVQGRVMLIGNAAHTLHPIASQGFNLAVYEVAALVDAFKTVRGNLSELDLNEVSYQLQKQQTISVDVSSRLPQLFAANNRWLNMTIQMGMVGLDVLLPFKKYFIHGMMGRFGAVPSMLRNAKDI